MEDHLILRNTYVFIILNENISEFRFILHNFRIGSNATNLKSLKIITMNVKTLVFMILITLINFYKKGIK
jgi:hypothetical protein